MLSYWERERERTITERERDEVLERIMGPVANGPGEQQAWGTSQQTMDSGNNGPEGQVNRQRTWGTTGLRDKSTDNGLGGQRAWGTSQQSTDNGLGGQRAWGTSQQTTDLGNHGPEGQVNRQRTWGTTGLRNNGPGGHRMDPALRAISNSSVLRWTLLVDLE